MVRVRAGPPRMHRRGPDGAGSRLQRSRSRRRLCGGSAGNRSTRPRAAPKGRGLPGNRTRLSGNPTRTNPSGAHLQLGNCGRAPPREESGLSVEAVPSKYARATDRPCARSGKAVPRKPADGRATYPRLVYASSPNATGPPEHRLIHNRTVPLCDHTAHTCRPLPRKRRWQSSNAWPRFRSAPSPRSRPKHYEQGRPTKPAQIHSQRAAPQPHRHQRSGPAAATAAPAPNPGLPHPPLPHPQPQNRQLPSRRRTPGSPDPGNGNRIPPQARPHLPEPKSGAPANVNDPSPANTSPAANTPLPPKRKKRHFATRTGHPTCCQQRATPLTVSPPSKAPRKTLRAGPVSRVRPPPKSTRIRPPRNLTVTGETEQPRAASTARRRSGAATPGLPHPPLPHPQTPGFRVGDGEPHVHPIRENEIKFHPRPTPAASPKTASAPLPPKTQKRHSQTRTGHPTPVVCNARKHFRSNHHQNPRQALRARPVSQAPPHPNSLARGPPRNLTVTGGTTQPRSTARGRSGAAGPGLPHPPLPQPQTPGFRVGDGEPHIHPIGKTGSNSTPGTTSPTGNEIGVARKRERTAAGNASPTVSPLSPKRERAVSQPAPGNPTL